MEKFEFEEIVLKGLGASHFQEAPLFLIALSGGADSTALAAALASLRDKDPSFKLHALHVNHGIRPTENCSVDENAARDLCAALKIPFTVTVIPRGKIEEYGRKNGSGMESAARHFRYKALEEAVQKLGADALLTGHTRDDRLETILMAFLRGGGPRGLGALAGNTVLPGNSIPLLRPLLSLSRSDILSYLEERNQSYCTDETNADEHFFRNRVRRHLIPLLDQHFPHWREPVLRLGDTQAMTASFLAEAAHKFLPWDNYSLPREQFFSEREILREEALFEIIGKIDKSNVTGKNPQRDTLRSFARGSVKTMDLGHIRLENKNGRITIKKAERYPSFLGFSVLIKSRGVYKLDHITVFAGIESDVKEMKFYAAFPLVVHSDGEGKITAEDRNGKVLVVKKGRLVWKREEAENESEQFYLLTEDPLTYGSK